MSQIEEIRAFVTVVETGSLTQAAGRLGIAVSAVSRRLKDLELRLGAPLIQRSTRRMYLNETGQRFFNRCRTILDELEAAQEEVQNTGGILSGVLRLNAPLSFGITHIAPLITDFMKENPELRIDIDLSDKRIDLIAEGFDLAIRIGTLQDSSLIAKKISTARQMPCASPDFIAKHGPINTADDLSDVPGLVYANSRTPSDWGYVTPEGKAGTVHVSQRLSSTNGDVLRDAAIAGLGVVNLPTFLLFEAIKDGTLVPLMADHDWSELDIFAVYPKTTILPRRTRAFVDFMAWRFDKNPHWNQIKTKAQN